jgi:hypothetical protein
MLTTGSKFFFAGTVLALVGMVVYGVGTSWQEYVGWVVLGSVATISAFLGGVTVAFRDANIDAPAVDAVSAADAEGRLRGASRGVPPSMWPAVGGFGLALLAIGLVLDWRLFLLGLVAVAAAGVEWVVQSWADRASDDPAYNERIRARLMHPIEFPVLAVLGGGLVVFGFSRVMLALSKEGSIWAFIGLGVIILIAATLFAVKPKLSKNLASGALVIGGVAILVAGIIGIAQGERSFAHGEKEEEDGTNQVGDKANAAAVIVSEGGTLTPSTLTLARSVVFNVIFENANPEGEQRLVIVGPERTTTNEDGAEVTEPEIFESVAISEGKRALVTFEIGTPGTYEMRTEGEGPEATGELIVP